MRLLFDHWEVVFWGPAAAGALAWLIAAARGLWAYLQLFRWAASVDRPSAYIKAVAASVFIAAGLAALLYPYALAMGFLAFLLIPM
jgi:hypothetical protein